MGFGVSRKWCKGSYEGSIIMKLGLIREVHKRLSRGFAGAKDLLLGYLGLAQEVRLVLQDYELRAMHASVSV